MFKLKSKNVVVGSRRTSMRLEPTMWDAFAEISRREGQPINALVSVIDRNRGTGGLTCTVRIFILTYFQRRTNEAEARLHADSLPVQSQRAQSQQESGPYSGNVVALSGAGISDPARPNLSQPNPARPASNMAGSGPRTLATGAEQVWAYVFADQDDAS